MGLASLFAIGCSAVGLGQTAQVVFYSNASIYKQLSPVSKGGAFYGNIFDDNKRLASLKHGQFAAFKLPAGAHVFGAGLGSEHKPDNLDLAVNLEDGQRYYIAVTADITNAGILVFQSAHMNIVDCASAHLQAEKTQPVPQKHIDQNYRSVAINTNELPQCGS